MKKNKRTLIGALLISLVVLSSSNAQKEAYPDKGLFKIPPNGQAEKFMPGADFEMPTAIAFDSMNRPYMMNNRNVETYGYILTLRNGKWVKLSYLSAIKKLLGEIVTPQLRDPKGVGTLTFDKDDDLYIIMAVPGKAKDKQGKVYRRGRNVLLYSPDYGETFQAYDVAGYTMEIRTGANELEHPPAIVTLNKWLDHEARFGNYNFLNVTLPVKQDGRLIIPESIQITDRCSGIAVHSGGYSVLASKDGKTHIAYIEIPNQQGNGNPTFISTIDRKTNKIIKKQFVFNAHPDKVDSHSSPVISFDHKGYLHMVCGAHVGSFGYLRSKIPNSIDQWTDPVKFAQSATYATLFCDYQNKLHCIFRRHKPYPTSLCYRSMAGSTPGQWSGPVRLVQAPVGHAKYGIYYHHLFIDRKGVLYLAFTFYDHAHMTKGYPEGVLVSLDNGKSWTHAKTDTFRNRIVEK